MKRLAINGGETLLDDEDFERYGTWKWRVSTGGVQWTYKVDGKTVTLWLHRVILGLDPGDPRHGDHINRDRLDNRRENLRIVTPAQNMHNKSAYRNGRSGLRGVSWHAGLQMWRARVGVNGRRVHLGYFTDKQDAAAAAREGRLRLLSHAHD